MSPAGDATDGPGEIYISAWDDAWLHKPPGDPDNASTRYIRADRNCLGCKHGTADEYDTLKPEDRSVRCGVLMGELDIELSHPPYAGGSTIESIELPGNASCWLWKSKE